MGSIGAVSARRDHSRSPGAGQGTTGRNRSAVTTGCQGGRFSSSGVHGGGVQGASGPHTQSFSPCRQRCCCL